jgi:hypothetical protein
MATTSPKGALTQEIADVIVESVSTYGSYAVTAAKKAGIHKATFYRWRDRGEDALMRSQDGATLTEQEQAYLDFYLRLTHAEATVEEEALAKVREAKIGWQAHMTYLERRFSERWRRTDVADRPKHGAKTVDEELVSLSRKFEAFDQKRAAE